MEILHEEAIPVQSRWWIVMLLVMVLGGSALASLLQGRAGEEAAAMDDREPILLSVHATPFRAGEETWFALALGLMTRQERTLAFSTAQRYDFAIYPEGAVQEDGIPGAPQAPDALWRWSEGRMFAQVVGRETFAADQLHLFTVMWDGTDRSSERLPPGRYRLEGRLTTVTERLVAQAWIDIP